ncbi:hypothetical protein [Paenibacillus tianjinensis]|uniref:Uncharacterized protein n=1 Tax=Paenibacillus tianjinensis TaxID=2810347 RepID=A0ABX7L9S4_9BACL|nr:hypothetical protein [Paenibacillus tianjinensis]QSF43483.1 hypothetical protein JRJ22_19660 [Paenibacillus tianjinensis]
MSTLLNEKKPFLDFKTLEIDDHAVRRVEERFKRKGRNEALNYCKCLLGQSRYIGETTCERGNRAHMFVAPNKVAIYLTLDYHEIKTIMKVNDKPFLIYDNDKDVNAEENDKTENTSTELFSSDNPLQEKLIKLYQVEFRKIGRVETKVSREVNEEKLKLDIEISELKYRLYKSRSAKVKNQCEKRIEEVQSVIIKNNLRLKKVEDDKRKIAKALASMLSI